MWLVCTHNRKGISRSAKPYRRSAPSWLKATAPSVIDQISKMAKKGMTPSQIGVMLRDSHGIAQVKAVTGSKILRILKSQGAYLNPKLHRLARSVNRNRRQGSRRRRSDTGGRG